MDEPTVFQVYFPGVSFEAGRASADTLYLAIRVTDRSDPAVVLTSAQARELMRMLGDAIDDVERAKAS